MTVPNTLEHPAVWSSFQATFVSCAAQPGREAITSTKGAAAGGRFEPWMLRTFSHRTCQLLSWEQGSAEGGLSTDLQQQLGTGSSGELGWARGEALAARGQRAWPGTASLAGGGQSLRGHSSPTKLREHRANVWPREQPGLGGVVRNFLAVVLLKLHLNKGLRENFWVNPHYPHLSTLQLLQQ